MATPPTASIRRRGGAEGACGGAEGAEGDGSLSSDAWRGKAAGTAGARRASGRAGLCAAAGPVAAWSSLALCLGALFSGLLDVPANSCAMTYMWPNYIAVPVPHDEWGTRTSYSLYLYREGAQRRDVTGLPVLFVPGNAGSGKQVRSMGSQAHADLEELAKAAGSAASAVGSPRAAELDFWAVDFEEELSALSGGDLRAQAQFVCRAIPFVVSRYSPAPQGVVLVGHSMGGIVARLVAGPFCNAHQGPSDQGGARVLAVFTIATPHTGLPAVVDPLLRNMFSAGADFWRSAFDSSGETSGVSELVMMSLGGGERDVLVGTDRTDMHQLCPPTHCLSVSTTALAGAWLSVDHRASLWCNQVVRVLTSALRSLVTVRGDKGFEWKKTRAAMMEALHKAVLPGPRMLEGVSYAAPHVKPELLHFATPNNTGASASGNSAGHARSWQTKWLRGDRYDSVSGEDSHDGPAYLRIPEVEEDTAYLWRVPALTSADGVGGSLIVASSLATMGQSARVILCGEEVDTLALHAGAEHVARACLTSPTRQDVTDRAVRLQGGGCHARWNADCVPSEPPAGGVRWLLTVAAHELRPLQMLCILGPKEGAGPGWLVGLRLVPPASSDEMFLSSSALFYWSSRLVDEKGLGAWYLPAPTLPASMHPVPAAMILEHTSDSCHAPLFKPVVLQTAETLWSDGVGEGWARAEVEVGEHVGTWRQQRRASWLAHGAPAAVVVLADPHCRYNVRVRGSVFGAMALSMRRHITRLFPLAGAALCLRRIFANSTPLDPPLRRPLVDLVTLMVFLWVLVLAHPVVVCLFWAGCSRCRSLWGCTGGGSVVADMTSEAGAAWGIPAAWSMGNRDSVSWSHVEHPLVSGLLVAAATAFSILLTAVAAAISSLVVICGGPTCNGSAGRGKRWHVATVLAAGCGILHPVLASLTALIHTVHIPSREMPILRKDVDSHPADRGRPVANGSHPTDQPDETVSMDSVGDLVDGQRLGALSVLCVVVRMPSFVALVRCLAVSAEGHNGRLAVLYQDRVGPSLESFSGGALGKAVGSAHSLDIIAGMLLPCVARVYASQRAWRAAHCSSKGRSTPQHAGMGWEGLWLSACAFAMLLVQEDVYVLSWIVLIMLAKDTARSAHQGRGVQ